MNKIKKTWINNILVGIISILLLWYIYYKVHYQISSFRDITKLNTGPIIYLWVAITLMLLNFSLETTKWYLLVTRIETISIWRIFGSYLAGMAFSIITPNRIGEYPGRILYIGNKQTFSYINVAIIGALAQLFAVFLMGIGGLIYYNIVFHTTIAKIALVFCIIGVFILWLVYLNFTSWLDYCKKIKWFKKIAIYIQLIKRVSIRKQYIILGISLLRFIVYSVQYLFLLLWMNVNLPLFGGFCFCVLFFWIMTVIPSVALSEIGIRGSVGIFLFQHFSTNTIGILVATTAIWLINLIFPAILGSIAIFKLKLIR